MLLFNQDDPEIGKVAFAFVDDTLNISKLLKSEMR